MMRVDVFMSVSLQLQVFGGLDVGINAPATRRLTDRYL
jgi:hypothetical protein